MTRENQRRAIFVDKDGTLIPDVPYNVNPELIDLSEGAGEALGTLCELGYVIIIVSNQSGVAHGYFEEKALQPVWHKISDLLRPYSVDVEAFHWCPHHPDGTVRECACVCNCRKPQPGMLYQAARDSNVNLSQSWMIGDILTDAQAGHTAGCQTIIIEKPDDKIPNPDNHNYMDYLIHSWHDVVSIVSEVDEQSIR